MTNLYALIRNNQELDLQRIPLDANVQREINDAFVEQSINMVAERDEIPYSGDYKADIDEVFSIGDYELPIQIQEALSNPLDNDVFNINNYDGKIIAIVSRVDDAENSFIGFQNFDTRKVINRGLSLWLSDNVYGRYNEKGISIPQKMDVLFKDGKIYFQSFVIANRILDLSTFFEDATEEDLDTFIDNDSLEFEDSVGFRDDLTSTLKKKLHFIVKSGIMDNVESSIIYQKAKDMDVEFELNEDENKILIPRDKNKAKELIQLLNEDYFISLLTQTKYVTNSKRRK